MSPSSLSPARQLFPVVPLSEREAEEFLVSGVPVMTRSTSLRMSEKRRWEIFAQRIEETAERVREVARRTHAGFSPEWQSVISLQKMLFWVEDAVRTDDLDSLLVYERFPELLDSKRCFFIDTMRVAFGVKEIAHLVTVKHIEVYELVTYLCHGDFTLEDELEAHAAGRMRPPVEAELDRPARKDYLQRCFLLNVDEAPAMAQLVQTRNIWNPEILLALVKGSTNASVLVDGAL